jgi:large subunit ribosomal protein L29
MKPAKWRDLSEDEIRQKVRELTEEVFNLRFQLSMGVAKNPSRLGQARRDVARALTVLREQATRVAPEPEPVRPAAPPAAIGAAIAAVTEPPVSASRVTKKASAKRKTTTSAKAKTTTKKSKKRA